MATGDCANLRRLRQALVSINSGSFAPIEEVPPAPEEHPISYGSKEYARVLIDLEGRVSLIPNPQVDLDQLELVLNVYETLLTTTCGTD